MIGTPAKPNDPKVGRVLGGGRVKKEYPFTLVIKENRESFRTSKMLENVVNERFHQTEDGHQKGVATAKTPSYLELKVPTLYHQNQDAILPGRPAPADDRQPRAAGAPDGGLEQRAARPHDGRRRGDEARGTRARRRRTPQRRASRAPIPRSASSPPRPWPISMTPRAWRPWARPRSSQPEVPGLCPGRPGGPGPAGVAPEAAKADGRAAIEVRYGAFNALRTLDPHDPFLGQVRVLDEPKARR